MQMVDDITARAEQYRRIARSLRGIALARLRLDLCRRDQLLALARGFERYADRIGRSDAKAAAD
ncbi:MAG TPA: hypothetical protein VE993_14145 [Stellaceae bacterium]|nr:hypothetical protein [Stellaceae bacterium]